MKTLTIGTKRQAERASLNTLFKPVNGHTATMHERYDRGKYAHDCRGREVQVHDGIVALYTLKRKDSDGPYWALYCIHTGN